MPAPTQGYQWTLVDAHPTRGRTFRRPLDTTELSFFWDRRFNGTADNVQHVALRYLCSDDGAHRGSSSDLFSEANVVRAWLSTKRRYPLAGATLVSSARGNYDDGDQQLNPTGWGRTDSTKTLESRSALASGPGSKSVLGISADSVSGSTQGQGWDFVVREADLADLRPSEVVFGKVANAEEAQRQALALLSNPRSLSDSLLVRLYVFRETGPTHSSEESEPDVTATAAVLHVMTLMAHCVTDGMANHTFIRCFVDTLARGAGGSETPAQVPLEERLTMAVPTAELEPAHVRALSPARRRWRMAVGLIIFQLRMAKRQGGHTLPCRLTRSTPYVAARSGYASTTFTPAQSTAVIANCRLHDVTFGNTLLPLGQVAMTRVLFRRYLRGEISEAEWEHRKRQPHISGGPLNIRSYLDRAWFERGGGGEFMLSIGLFYHQLPFMTLGSAASAADPTCRTLANGAPPFEELLTFDRFLHRAGLVKRQTEGYLKHPLSFEIARAVSLARLERTRNAALQWMKRLEDVQGSGTQDSLNGEFLAVTDMPMVWAHGGSSLGDVESIFPSEYPLPPSHPLSPSSPIVHPAKAGYATPPMPSTSVSDVNARPTITVEYSGTRLHARPAELYLGAASSRGRMTLFVFYDGNVFEDGVVKEWLDEVEGAVLWYLGRKHTKSGRSDSLSRVARGGDDVVGPGAGGGGSARLGRGHLSARL